MLRSPDLVGAELDLGDGNVLRIDAVRTDPEDPTIFLHSFSTRDAVSDWQNPCDADASGKREGFPLPGRWDANGAFHPGTEHFALTCTSGAQAKCIRFGYKPWKQSKDGQSLLPLYEACIRMVRADYCGTGEATTLDGTEIDIYDDRSIQHPKPAPSSCLKRGGRLKVQFASTIPASRKTSLPKRWRAIVPALRTHWGKHAMKQPRANSGRCCSIAHADRTAMCAALICYKRCLPTPSTRQTSGSPPASWPRPA